jgi:hypothetical protein
MFCRLYINNRHLCKDKFDSRAGAEAGAGGVRPRGHPVDAGEVLQQPRHLRAGGRAAPGHHRHHGRGRPQPHQGLTSLSLCLSLG